MPCLTPWRAPSQLAANLCREREETRGGPGGGRARETDSSTALMFYSLYGPFLLVCRQGCEKSRAGEGQGRCSGRGPSSWPSPGDAAAVPVHNLRGPSVQRTHAATETRPATRAIRCLEPSPGRHRAPEAPASHPPPAHPGDLSPPRPATSTGTARFLPCHPAGVNAPGFFFPEPAGRETEQRQKRLTN